MRAPLSGRIALSEMKRRDNDQVKEPAVLLHEAYRLLKPAGHLVSATDCYAEPVPFPVRLMLSAQIALRPVRSKPRIAS
jgi:hypothetical protein